MLLSEIYLLLKARHLLLLLLLLLLLKFEIEKFYPGPGSEPGPLA